MIAQLLRSVARDFWDAFWESPKGMFAPFKGFWERCLLPNDLALVPWGGCVLPIRFGRVHGDLLRERCRRHASDATNDGRAPTLRQNLEGRSSAKAAAGHGVWQRQHRRGRLSLAAPAS